MIRDASTLHPLREPAVASRDDDRDGVTPPGLRGTGMADRFCAWRGHAARGTIFSIFPFDVGDDIAQLPIGDGAVMLGVRRNALGTRRVLWAASVRTDRPPAGLVAALEALAGGEVHLHWLAAGETARRALIADLGFPPLRMAGRSTPPVASPYSASMVLGASMNPPDWRCQRSA